MKPAPFAYTKAKTLKEAVTLLAKHKDDARLLAGGQSLIATLNMRLSAPDLLIDINGIKNLDGIAKKGKYVEIGALARHAQVEHSDVSRKARAPDRACDAAYWPSCNPQPRHLRRLHRLCGSGGRIAGLPTGTRRRDRHRGPARKAQSKGRRFFQGPVRNRPAPAGNDYRRSYSCCRQDHTRRLRRTGTPSRRLRDCRSGSERARQRQRARPTCGSPISVLAIRRSVRRKPKRRSPRGDIDAAVKALDLDPHDDVQATAKTKKHLAGVLLRRVAKQLMEARG